jgi:hypothetical protein
MTTAKKTKRFSSAVRSPFVKRARFWEQEYSLTALLVMLVITLFVVTPLVSGARISSELGLGFVDMLTITGVAAVTARRSIVFVVVALAIAGITLDWAAHFSGGNELLPVLDFVVRLAFVLLLAVVVTIQVFRPGNVTHHRVQGAICVYLLAGLAWAYSYEILLLLNPLAIRLPTNDSVITARTGILRYFSFVTLTTLGYGDVLPGSPVARTLAISEALFGQLYPAVMITRLVSLEISDRRKADPKV